MRLKQLFSKNSKADSPSAVRDPSASAGDTLQQARTQARRRLIGALVLLVAAVVAFPMIFETQPRPAAGDLVLTPPANLSAEPERAGAAAEKLGQRADAAQQRPLPSGAGDAAANSATGLVTTQALPPTPAANPAASPAPAPATVAAAAAAPEPAPAKAVAPAAKPAEKPESKPEPKPEPKPASKPPAKPAEAAASPAPAPAAAGNGERWVVQVGAFSESTGVRVARQRAEKLGFKTYITDINTAAGKRTRVRLGPFSSKSEADAAAAKAKAAGLAANVLQL